MNYQCVLGECGEFEKSGSVTNMLRAYLEESMALEDRLSSHITELISTKTYVESEIEKTRFALAVYEDDAKTADSLTTVKRHDSTEDVKDELFCGKTRVSDIKDCETQREALYIIARMNDGSLHLNSAAGLIVAAGLSKATPRSVSGNLHTYLSNNNDFDWVGPSQFRLKSDNDDELTTGEEMVLGEDLKRVA
jgi:hypothetical protein